MYMSALLRLCFGLVLLIPALVRAATLENPGNGSFYSGIGVISGWKCTANGPLTVRFNDGDPVPLAYGNERTDVRDARACSSAHVGFVSIMNWANLGDGTHTAVVYDNGVEFARSTFEVATTGESFVRGAEGECRVPDFPAPGETMQFAWNQNTQHLEMVNHRGGSGSGGEDAPGVPRNVRVTEVGEDFVVVEWDPPTGGGAVSYNTYYRSPNEPEYLLGNVTTIGSRVSGTVVPGECYRVTAVNAAGVEGEKSPEVCVPAGGGGSGGPATLENPGNGSFYSGIGVVSGWKCTANGPLTVRFNDGDPIPLTYGNARSDVRDAGACPSAHVGFVSIMNWGNLGDGEHTAVAYDNGVEFARSTFTVATTGEPFVRGAEGECRVPDFPALGESMQFAWNQNTQHLEMVNSRGGNGSGDGGSSSGEAVAGAEDHYEVRVPSATRASLTGRNHYDLYTIHNPTDAETVYVQMLHPGGKGGEMRLFPHTDDMYTTRQSASMRRQVISKGGEHEHILKYEGVSGGTFRVMVKATLFPNQGEKTYTLRTSTDCKGLLKEWSECPSGGGSGGDGGGGGLCGQNPHDVCTDIWTGDPRDEQPKAICQFACAYATQCHDEGVRINCANLRRLDELNNTNYGIRNCSVCQ